MKAFANSPKMRPLAIGLACLAAVIGVYVFSTGPVCRWRPGSAERIFAPLNVLTELPLTRPLVRAWLSVWGVDFNKRNLILLQGEPQGREGGGDSHLLGVETADGKFVPYTNGMKIAIHRKKAETGDPVAQERLASALWDDSPTNHVEAYKWAAMAASQGRKSAKDLVHEFELFMTPEELTQGKAESEKGSR
jgi:hypothetical protein